MEVIGHHLDENFRLWTLSAEVASKARGQLGLSSFAKKTQCFFQVLVQTFLNLQPYLEGMFQLKHSCFKKNHQTPENLGVAAATW